MEVECARAFIPTSRKQKRKDTNSTKQTSITEYLDKNEEEFEDDDDGWTTEYEPMKPLSSPPAKRTTTAIADIMIINISIKMKVKRFKSFTSGTILNSVKEHFIVLK